MKPTFINKFGIGARRTILWCAMWLACATSSAATNAITSLSSDQIVTTNSSAGLRAQVTATVPLSYWWLRDGSPTRGVSSIATNAPPVAPANIGKFTVSLNFENIGTADVGRYSLVVSNSVGMVTNSVARLDVLLGPYVLNNNAMPPGANGILPFGGKWSATSNHPETNNNIGQEGGVTWHYSEINLATYPDVTLYWGPLSPGIPWGFEMGGVMLSFHGRTDEAGAGDVLEFRPDLSNLASGLCVWTGRTLLPDNQTAYTRFLLTVTTEAGGPLAMQLAEGEGLPSVLGPPVLRVTPGLDFKANFIFLASSSEDSANFVPAYAFYNQWQIAKQTEDYKGQAASDFSAGFYYDYQPPRIDVPPKDIAATSGDRVFLSVQGGAYRSLAYQWLRDGQKITGTMVDTNGNTVPTGSGSTLDLGYVSTNASGLYTVELVDGDVHVSSSKAKLTVSPVRVQAGTIIPRPVVADLSKLTIVGPGVFPLDAANWNQADNNLYASAAESSAKVTWYDSASNAIPVEVVISIPPATQVRLGQKVPVPSWVNEKLIPVTGPHVDTASDPRTILLWHPASRSLYATAVGLATVDWPLSGQGPVGTVPVRVQTSWPTDAGLYQNYVANSPATILKTTGNGLSTTKLMDQTAGLGVDGGQVQNFNRFAATNSGQALLLLANQDVSTATNIFLQFIRSIQWQDTNYLRTNQCIIGQVLTNFSDGHSASFGAPYMLNALSRYCALPGYLNRAARTGPIIAVNRDSPATDKDDLVLVYYQGASKLLNPANQSMSGTDIGWPYRPVRFDCSWPTNAPHAVIASQLGTGIINPATYASWQLYVQNDPALPGFNPNDEHALRWVTGKGEAVFPLRNDLGTPTTSDPYLLITYQDGTDGLKPKIKVFKVVDQEAPYFFETTGVAGVLLQQPFPLSVLAPCPESYGSSGPFWRDRKLSFWAKAAGDDGGRSHIVLNDFYPVQTGFYFPSSYFVGNPANVVKTNLPPVGTDVPWLDLLAGTPGKPHGYGYTITWPSDVPSLRVGETLVKAKFKLPTIDDPLAPQTSVKILYQQSVATGHPESVKLIDGTAPRQVPLLQLPSDIIHAQNEGLEYFPTLPPQLRERFYFDPNNARLVFKGQFVDQIGAAEPIGYFLLNVLSPTRELRSLLELSKDPKWTAAVNVLGLLASQATEVLPETPFNHPLALTTSDGGGVGYVTLAYGYSTNLDKPADPIKLEVIQVSCPLYRGQIEVIQSENPFDEKLTLRHSADFGGLANHYVYEWRTLPPKNGLPQTDIPPGQWASFPVDPPVLGSLTGQGSLDITIQGSGLYTLSDNFFVCRYRSTNTLNPCGTDWSSWTEPMLAPGWISRVLVGVSPFNQVFDRYRTMTNNTIVSMLALAGQPYQGAVPLNASAAINLGLIEVYTSIFQRGIGFSIEGSPPVNYPPANLELLDVGGRLSDLYMLLGNEAYAEASDPTITIPAGGAGIPAVEASAIHVFQNQTASRLEEELKLLRGRDSGLLPSVQNSPFYNRLIWNFSGGNGEIAYANKFGVSTLQAARRSYPMGHGDAWGHYLSAISPYYLLLRHTNFTWLPQIEAVLVGGVPVSVDYEHERKFASAAAARARTGADIVNLTYRNAFVEDPTGQWQGYLDSDTNRAWGVAEWGSRAGQAALFDWVMANAILPPVSTNTGIQKIDRTTVSELGAITSGFFKVQSEVDKADVGLNPLGLAKNVIPFDIEPSQTNSSHFEQIYARAVGAVNNTLALFNLASGASQALRGQADTLELFNNNVQNQEADYNSRLIEVFGYPYADDIGPLGAYPSGYTGPDLYHFMYFDPTQILGVSPPDAITFVATNRIVEVVAAGYIFTNLVPVTYNMALNDYGYVKPANWSTQRRAPGRIQFSHSDLLQAKAAFDKGVADYENLVQQIEDQAGLLQSQYNVNAQIVNILNTGLNNQASLAQSILNLRGIEMNYRNTAAYITTAANAAASALPEVFGIIGGLANGVTVDPGQFARGTIMLVGAVSSQVMNNAADAASLVELDHQQAQQLAQNADSIMVTALNQSQAVAQQLDQLQELVRQEATSRLQVYQLLEASQQAAGKYAAAVAAGEQLLSDRLRFRQQTAGQIQQYRYKDMAYRIFQNDALQKYRAQFDLAATYVYLSAAAYDYETALAEGDPHGPGSTFMTSIVRARSIGQISNGQPIPGSSNNGDDPGLADPMARMFQNFEFLKGSIGLDNPDFQTTQFSLRSEAFRVQAGQAGSAAWQSLLSQLVVSNILTYPEFKRYCIPPSPLLSVEPGIVIPFSTTVGFGQNFFGWPLAGGDNTYDSSHFATKIRSVGVWFANFDSLAMSTTPSVYLIPIGNDFLRVPGGDGTFRSWKIVEQLLPVPFPVGITGESAPDWIPVNDTLGNQYYGIRRYAALRAYNDGGFNQNQVTSSSRLIGRSVWNTRWLLIIPAGNLLSDRNEAIQRFIYGSLKPNGQRDGSGVSDIKLFFQTASYPGF